MRTFAFTRLLYVLCFMCFVAFETQAQRVTENLSRGLIALNKGGGQVYVGWRLLGTDPQDVAFNLYRSTGGSPTLIAKEITASTNYVDKTSTAADVSYFVRPVVNGVEQAASASYTLKASTTAKRYISIPLTPEPDGPLFTNGSGTVCDPYSSGSSWLGDVDNDGEWEYIVLRNYEGTVAPTDRSYKIDCYELDGTLRWRTDLGINITGGVNGHGWMAVADFDGDGKAEIATKTCEETVFNYGSKDSVRIGDTDSYGFGKDGITRYQSDITGPEFLSIIDGETGREKARTNFEPGNGWNPKTGTNGYTRYGANERPSYIYFAVAYLDGVLPSLVLVRGAGGDNTPAFAFDYRNGAITERWRWGKEFGAARGLSQAHNILTFDLDNDGKDEILFLGSALDHDGTTMFHNRDFTHGDHYRLMDMDPDRPGYEFFAIQQNNGSLVGMSTNDASTGEYLSRHYLTQIGDLSRGDAGDYDPRYRGAEYFSTMRGLYTCKGEQITNNYARFPTWDVWWDADLGREFIDGVNSVSSAPAIEKWNTGNNSGENRIYSIYNEGVHMGAYNGRPSAWGDFFGDWREEMIVEANNHRELRIYSTWDVASNRIYCLMQNPGYRMEHSTKGRIGAAYPDFFLGYGMETPPPPPIVKAKLHWSGNNSFTWNLNNTNWMKGKVASKFAQGDTVLFDLTGNNTSTVLINEEIKPGMISIHSPIDYTFSGTGSLAGTMPLVKVGKSTAIINCKTTYSGKTTVWDGALIVNDTLKNSPVTVYGGTWGGPLSKGLTGGRVGGKGYYAAGVTLNFGGAISPGAGVSLVDTIKMSNLTENAGATNFIDLTDDPTGKITRNDVILVKGNIIFTDSISVVINLLKGMLKPGNYTLFKYSGTFTGDLAKIKIIGCEAIPYTITNTGGIIALSVKTVRPAASVVWAGTAANWDLAVTSNWLRKSVADVFVSKDSVVFNNIGAAQPNVNLTQALLVGNVLVDGTTNYTFGGKGIVIGTAKLTKRGAGSLTLQGQNTYTGATVIEAGTLNITNLDDGGNPSSIGSSSGDSSNFVLNGGATLSHIGLPTSTKRLMTINTGECSINVVTGSSLALLGRINGAGTLVKTGSGALILGTKNIFTGNTIIKEGLAVLGSDASNIGGLGSGTVTIMGGVLEMVNSSSSLTSSWNMIVPTGSSGGFHVASRWTLKGSLTGGGTLDVDIPYVCCDFGGNWSAFTGTINITGNDFRVANANGYEKAAFNLAASGANIYHTAGSVIKLGALSGVTGSYVSGTFVVGSKNTDATYSGTINGTSLVTKTGTGAWTLTGASTYTGTTTVNGGTLIVTNTTGSATGTGAVNIITAGTLSGTGIIAGATTVNTGGTIAPGNNAIGTLSINNALTFATGSKLNIEVNNATKTNDTLASNSSITLNGTLTMLKLDAGDYVAGNSYKILKATVISGRFVDIVPAEPATNLQWDTTQLRSAGIISVKTKPNTAYITASGATSFCAGGKVTLSATTGTAYKWLNGTIAAGTTQSISATASGSYTVEVTFGNGTKSTSVATQITVNTPEAISFNYQVNAGTWVKAVNATLCTNDNLQFAAWPVTGSTWQWTGPNGFTANTRNPLVSVTDNAIGSYTATQTDANGCSSTAQFTVNKGICPLAQSITLVKGWNLISTNVRTSDSTIATLFNGLDVQEIKTMNSFWRKSQNDVFNGLKTITPAQGYLVNMNVAGTLTITGTPVQTQFIASPQSASWNMIGCPYQAATSFSQDFNTSNCSIIKSFEGFWVPNGGASNSIQNISPGKAYFIKK